MELRSTKRRIRGSVKLAFLAALSVVTAVGAAAEAPDLDAWRTIAAQPGNAAKLEPFAARLALVEEVARVLGHAFEASRQASLDSLLDEVTDVAGRRSTAAGPGAHELFAVYRRRFAEPLSLPDLPARDIETLRDIYGATVKAAIRSITESGRTIVSIDAQAQTTMVELCCVLPFLHTPDGQWSALHMDVLPAWLKGSDMLPLIERFALQLNRPHTAYQVHLSALTRDRTGQIGPGYLAYLQRSAERLVADHALTSAITCLAQAMAVARRTEGPGALAALRLRLAEVHALAGQHQLAADEAAEVLRLDVDQTTYGRAAMRRLNYLYKAGQFDRITAEGDQFQAEPRCRSHLPEILYIQWAANRRMNRPLRAAALHQQFTSHFPNHPLTADMHYALAVTSLAEGDYGEAQRQLEIIAHRYRDFRLADRVQKMRERLDQRMARQVGDPAGSE